MLMYRKYGWSILLTFFLFIQAVPVHAFTSNLDKNFLVIADIHLNIDSDYEMEISPSGTKWCNDLDKSNFERMIQVLKIDIQKGIIKKPHFIIVLGDIVGHHVKTSDKKIENESFVFKTLEQNFQKTPIFYTFGNNDSLVDNYGPFTSNKETNIKSVYDIAKSSGWKDGFLSSGQNCTTLKNIYPCIIEKEPIDGFYSAYIEPGLRLISINSVMFSSDRNGFVTESVKKQLIWLEKQLIQVDNRNESTLIVMHIPPGFNIYDHSTFWMLDDQKIFLNLVEKYHNSIIGLLASHTHAEELKIIKNERNQFISSVYYTAALSTSHGNEPSLKTFIYSKRHDRWMLTNYETFHYSFKNNTLNLTKLYDYKNYYCIAGKTNITDCLLNVTADKMKHFFSVGNPNFEGNMKSPDDIFLTITH